MKTKSSRRGTSRLAIPGAIVCLLIFSACGNTAGDKLAGKTVEPKTIAGSDGAASPSPTTTTATTVPNASQPGGTPSRDIRNNEKRPAANVPAPQIGTGGSDFFIFTQARAALDSDADLKAANIIIDVKAGLVTLSGRVGGATQKSKAEELVRAVGGVRAVKNQLGISG